MTDMMPIVILAVLGLVALQVLVLPFFLLFRWLKRRTRRGAAPNRPHGKRVSARPTAAGRKRAPTRAKAADSGRPAHKAKGNGDLAWGRERHLRDKSIMDGPSDALLERAIQRLATFSTPKATAARTGPDQGPGGRSSLWVPAGRSATVAGLDIGGMVYVGRHLHAEHDKTQERCLINPGLPVASKEPDLAGEGLPYWPSYSQIPPRSRLAYLRWLASGRSDPACPVGYVFLYFYGLERRLVLERPDAPERLAIVAEVERLLILYGDNRSFNRYGTALLETAAVLAPSDHGIDWGDVVGAAGGDIPLPLRVGLARLIAAGEPVTADWALRWWLSHPDSRVRTPARRAFEEFRALFALRFDAAHPDGLRVSPPKRPLRHTYRAASGTFERTFDDILAGLPEVAHLSAPVRRIAPLAESCIDDLDAYSRLLGKDPDARGTLRAHALLPVDLAAHLPNAERDRLAVWAEGILAAGDGLVPAETVIEQVEGAAPERIGRRALTTTADALARLGIGLAPDPRYALRMPKRGDPVRLFRLPEGVCAVDTPGAAYQNTILALTLGMMVAHADGTVSPKEREHLRTRIDHAPDISPSERARLHANLAWMQVCPPELGRLRKIMQSLPEGERQVIGRTVVAIAGVDGRIDPGEVAALEKLYALMDLPKDGLYSALHTLSGVGKAVDIGPVVVRPADEAGCEHVIPPPPASATPADQGGTGLDVARMSAIRAETTQVSRLLGAVFAEEGDEAPPSELATSLEPDEDTTDAALSPAPAIFDGLDRALIPLVEELASRARWTQEEFQVLAGHFGHMAEGAKETINEWAFSVFDDALIEDDDHIEVYTDLLEPHLFPSTGDRHEQASHQTA